MATIKNILFNSKTVVCIISIAAIMFYVVSCGVTTILPTDGDVDPVTNLRVTLLPAGSTTNTVVLWSPATTGSPAERFLIEYITLSDAQSDSQRGF